MHPTALLTPLIALYIPALAIPGQNFLAVTQASLEQSRRHGIVTALGVSSGSTLQAIVAALGVGFL
ncbi:MAG: LysE family translocator, partial [Thiomonas sp.]|nr:LysE family translocator [Thiomonas sp.]